MPDLWEPLQRKIVYANSISMAKQLAASGNADAAFTAYSLVLHDKGTVLKVDPDLYHPIEQALAIVASTSQMQEAQQFRSFLLGRRRARDPGQKWIFASLNVPACVFAGSGRRGTRQIASDPLRICK